MDGESKAVFTQLGSYIANESTGQRMPVSRRQGVFVFKQNAVIGSKVKENASLCKSQAGRTMYRQHFTARAHKHTFFSVRTLHVITRVAQDMLRASKVSLSSVMSLLNISSTPFTPYFLFTY